MSYAMQKHEYDKKFQRLISIIYRLGTAGHVKTPVLAREFNVTVRTVQRDLSIIGQGGFPLIRSSMGWKFIENFRFPFSSTRKRQR